MKSDRKNLYVVMSFVASLVLIAAGAFGLHWWLTKSPYMAAPPGDPRSKGIFFPLDILFLSIFLFAAPTGFLLLIYTITHVARQFAFNPLKSPSAQSLNLAMYLIIMLISIGSFGTFSFYAYRFAERILQCGYIFCLDESKWEPSDVAKVRQDAEGFRSILAAPMIMLSFAMIVTFSLMVLNQLYRYCCTPSHLRSSSTKTDKQQPLLGTTINTNESSMYDDRQPVPTSSYTPYNTYYQISHTGTASDTKAPVNTELPYMMRIVFFAIMAICMWFAIFFFATYVPGTYRQYYPTRLAAYAARPVTHDATECMDKGKWACPERLNAWMLTQQIKVSPHLILKLFPSNMIFFIFTLLAITFPVVARAIPPLDRVLQKKFKINAPTILFWFYAKRDRLLSFTPTYWSLYEIILSLWLTLGTSLFSFYWFHDHNWKTRWPRREQESWDNIMRASGQVAVLFLSLLMFPVARSSPLLQMMGISWDKGISFHKWMGIAFVLLTLVHVFASYATYYVRGGWAGVLEMIWAFPPIKYGQNRDNFTIPLFQLLTMMMFITIGIIAVYEPIRRAKYDLFLMCHHITYLTLIPAVIWHAQASWEYLAPAVTLYVSDRLFRLYRGSQAIELLPTTAGDFQGGDSDYIIHKSNSPFSVHSIDYALPAQSPITSINSLRKTHLSPHTNAFTAGPGVRLLDYGDAGKFVELRIDNRNHNIVFMPGNHFFYIQIAEISLFEWHPMTTSGHCHAQGHELSFLIKCEGQSNSWTNNLYNYVEKLTQKQLQNPVDASTLLNIPLTVCLDGPYGEVIDFNKYDNIVLVAGGSGITPAKAIYNSLWLSFLHDYIGNDATKANLQHELLSQVKETHLLNGIPLNDQKFETSLRDEIVKEDSSRNALTNVPKHVHLFFAARDPALFECLADSLSHIPTGPSVPFTAELLVSKQGSLVPVQTAHDIRDSLDPQNDASQSKIFHNLAHHISQQRDNDDALLMDSSTPLEQSIIKALKVKSLSDIKDPSRTIFFACGPLRLTEQAKDIAIKYGFHQHEEAFEL